MTSEDYVKGCVAICTTYERTDPVYIQIENVKNLTIKMVENYGETGTFQIVNVPDDQTKNLLSPTCEGWSDGQARKIDQTMFVRVYKDVNRDAINSIGVYKITTITASAELLTVEFCDCLQYLRSQGADYVYNHYEGGYTWHSGTLTWDSTKGKALITKPQNVYLAGGSRGDVRATYIADRDTLSENGDSMKINNGLVCFIPRSAYKGDYLKGIYNIKFHGIAIGTDYYELKIGHEENSSDIHFDSWTEQGIFEKSYTFDVKSNPEKYYVPNGFWIYLKTNHFLVQIDTRQSSVSGGKWKYSNESTYHWSRTIAITIGTEKESSDVIGAEDSSDHTKWYVDEIDGISITQDRIDDWPGTYRIYYPNPVGDTPNTQIIHDIVNAVGMDTDIPSGISSRAVSVFRCNGDLIHNYLLALADMPNSDDRQYVLYADRSEWGKIAVRTRFRTDRNPDTPVKTLAYAKDNVSGADAFMSFNPSVSLKNRPNLAVVKSSDESDHPIMVALCDPDIVMGSTDPVVSSNSTDVATAMLEAYSAIMTNRSNRWSGEIKLPYIVDDYFKRAESGECGGIPISITDSRYGFTNYTAKVKEITWNFADQTTTITLNNYSEMYANGLIDTTKMAYTSGGLSAESTNTDMFTRQFVNIKSDMVYAGDTATVSLIDRLGAVVGTADPTDVAIVKIPELNMGVVNAYFPYGTGTVSERHGIYAVKVNDTTVNIDQYRRPDKAQTESLIVNVIYKLT